MKYALYGATVVKNDAALSVQELYGYWGICILGAFDSTGKHYFEVVNLAANGYYQHGLYVLGGTITTIIWKIYDYRGGSNGVGTNIVTPPYSNAVGARTMVAYDMGEGKVWFGSNGIWFNSGNPSTGANPIYSNLSGYTVSPGVEVYSKKVQIIVDPDAFLYAPEGFLPPTENHPVAKLHAFHNIDRGGDVGIAGKVTEFAKPGAYRVFLHDQATGLPLAATRSAATGEYEFNNLNTKKKFVIAFDHTTPVQNAAIQDNVVPS